MKREEREDEFIDGIWLAFSLKAGNCESLRVKREQGERPRGRDRIDTRYLRELSFGVLP